MIIKKDLTKINDYLWEIPKSFRNDMRVPARFYASEKMLDEIFRDRSLEQLVNVATLPGIKKYALAMPDMHEGYGFPIGGVAAIDYKEGVISPGGIGYDINCGIRLLRTGKNFNEIKDYIENLAESLFKEIPSGVGKGGKLKLSDKELDEVLNEGAKWVVRKGYGNMDDIESIESEGSLKEADASLVSFHAKNRGKDQIGTMGGGNHFVEIDRIDEIYDKDGADKFGLQKDQIMLLIHTGSRGLGHQVATDYIKTMIRAMPKYNIKVPDIELACAPFSSREGQNYFAAMSAAANFAWANREMITWHVKKVWEDIFVGKENEISLIYDVAHNIAKIERQTIVHRKGATRAFPNQPVIIPGSMGTASYLLMGTDKAMEESFGSVCHGAGRKMSRHEALRQSQGKEVKEELGSRGIIVRTGSIRGLAEEAPYAYKDIDSIVDIISGAGIARKIARLKPVAVIKG